MAASTAARLFTFHGWPVSLIETGAAIATVTDAASRDPDQAIEKSRAGDAMDRGRHVRKMIPCVSARVVDIVIGKHAGGVFTAPDMEASRAEIDGAPPPCTGYAPD